VQNGRGGKRAARRFSEFLHCLAARIRALCAIALLASAAVIMAAEQRYAEPYRPQFHFSPQKNWTNDPCGLVYAFGQYHLFFQHNPFANVWGHMSWGHATSPDLLHWTQLPVAIPDDRKAAIFTGSSVVDTSNTSGLCSSPSGGCIVSIYTGYSAKSATTPERQTQNLAFSQDGRIWTKYSGNPVLDLDREDSRDPHVFWYAPTRRWILAMVLANDKKVRLFSSPNLREWHQLSDFGLQGATGGVWECPDLIQLPAPGQPQKTQWVLKVGINPGHIAGGSGEQYFVGQFDGNQFRNDNAPDATHWVDYGRDSYCALTFGNEPAPAAPRMIGWMNNWQYAGTAPTTPWRGAMTLPRTLSLLTEGGATTLVQHPIEQLRSLRADTFHYAGASETELNSKLGAWQHRSQTFEMELTIRPGRARRITWTLLQGEADQTLVGFDAAKQELFVDRSWCANAHFNAAFPSVTVAPLKLAGKPLQLQIFVDRSSVEVFAQDGRISMTNLVFPNATSTGISMSTTGGRLDGVELNMWKLHSTWQVYGGLR
jgi:fructan beta-fructosidase